ncbi:MAG TPA: AAA-like domain-containing protein [Polyangiaceae bacterium]
MAKVFISYKRDRKPDIDVADRLTTYLENRHEVFIDRKLTLGLKWERKLNELLSSCDVLIVLLSKQSVLSSNIASEVATVLQRNQGPRIIPIRLEFPDLLPMPLSQLNQYQGGTWEGEESEPVLFEKIEQALAEVGATNVPRDQWNHDRSEVIDGRVIRKEERDALAALHSSEAATLNICGPSHIGKKQLVSVLVSSVKDLRSVVTVDFNLFDRSALNNQDQFYRTIYQIVTEKLHIEPDFTHWSVLSRPQSLSKSMRSVLSRSPKRTVIVLTSLDRIVDSPFAWDLFGTLRVWHESRKNNDSSFQWLDMILVASYNLQWLMAGSATPSPFNVGTPIRLRDFTQNEVQQLGNNLGVPPSASKGLHSVLSGHPALTHRAMIELAHGHLEWSRSVTAKRLLDSGIFDEHLQHYLWRIAELPPETRNVVVDALRGKPCNLLTFLRLEGVGLVKGKAAAPLPRCELYGIYFRTMLD